MIAVARVCRTGHLAHTASAYGEEGDEAGSAWQAGRDSHAAVLALLQPGLLDLNESQRNVRGFEPCSRGSLRDAKLVHLPGGQLWVANGGMHGGALEEALSKVRSVNHAPLPPGRCLRDHVHGSAARHVRP
jgi:hypothetical protein